MDVQHFGGDILQLHLIPYPHEHITNIPKIKACQRFFGPTGQRWHGGPPGSSQTSSDLFIQHGDVDTVRGEVLTPELKVQAERRRMREDG